MNNASLCVSSDMWFVHLGAQHEVQMFPLSPHTAEIRWKCLSSPCSPAAALSVAISPLKPPGWCSPLAPHQEPWEHCHLCTLHFRRKKKSASHMQAVICSKDVSKADGFSINFSILGRISQPAAAECQGRETLLFLFLKHISRSFS